jgi:pimeloyl-ACP methyl ester carboxylesterase
LNTKPAVVCIHGMGGSDLEFASTCKILEAQGFRAIAVCLTGHGSRNKKALRHVSIYHYIEEVEGIIRKEEGPVILIGQSMGGLIAQKVAERVSQEMPGKITKIVLLMSGPPRWIFAVCPAVLKRMWRYLPAILRGRPFQPTDGDLEFLWLNRVKDPAERRRILEKFGPESGWAARQAIIGVPVEANKVKAKVLVVAGTYDRTLPLAIQDKIAKKYQARFMEVPHGHAALHEAGWKDTLPRIIAWIRG